MMTQIDLTPYELLIIGSIVRAKLENDPKYFTGGTKNVATSVCDKIVTYMRENNEAFVEGQLDFEIDFALNENKNKRGKR